MQKVQYSNISIFENNITEAFASAQAIEKKYLECFRWWCTYSSPYELFGLQPKLLLDALEVFHCRFGTWKT